MPYVTSIERIARRRGMEQGVEQGKEEGLEEGMEKGRKDGLEEGIEKGMEKGQRQEAMRVLRRLIIRRFDSLPQHIEDRFSTASTEQIEAWIERLMEAHSLEDVFGTDQTRGGNPKAD